ncbi:hypothetical protein [Streptacidiphilus sp. PAMC 29251]
MSLPDALLSLLTARAFTALASLVATVLVIALIARQTLRGANPEHRPAIIKALAELARALR